MEIKDITGQRFGRLTAIAYTGRLSEHGHNAIWLFRCDCGKYVERKRLSVAHVKTPSCGCYVKEHTGNLNKTHGGRHDRLYLVWMDMRRRCRDPKDANYGNYGGRGISVCDEWQDYSVFRDWAYSTGYDETAKSRQCTLDRIDTNGNYSPDNCRWADAKVQCNNKRNNVLIEYNGKVQTASQWADETGISGRTIVRRIRSGWTVEKALTTPVQVFKNR